MKTDDMMILGAAAVAVYLITRKGGIKIPGLTPSAPASTASAAGGTDWATLLQNNAQPGQPGAGWQYFSDGTAISPSGVYYMNGVQVWAP